MGIRDSVIKKALSLPKLGLLSGNTSWITSYLHTITGSSFPHKNNTKQFAGTHRPCTPSTLSRREMSSVAVTTSLDSEGMWLFLYY